MVYSHGSGISRRQQGGGLQRRLTIGLHDMRDGLVSLAVLLVPLDVLPDGLDARHQQHEHQRRRGAQAAVRAHGAPPGQAGLRGKGGEGVPSGAEQRGRTVKGLGFKP